MGHPERNVYTQENYELLWAYTRGKTFKFKPRDEVVEELRSIGILKVTDSASVATNLLARLTEHGAIRIKHSVYAGEPNQYKFTGGESKWHLLNQNRNKDTFLDCSSGPTAEIAMILKRVWYNGT